RARSIRPRAAAFIRGVRMLCRNPDARRRSAKKSRRSTWSPAIFTDVRRQEDSMYEHELQILIAGVKAGRMSRRAFVRKIVGLGLTAPFASQLLAQAGLAQAPAKTEYKPTKAGGGGPLRMLYWQAATLLQPPFAR